MNIIAIGGGDLATGETLPIDLHIVQLTDKKCPHALFIPTASSDDAGYQDAFRLVYGGHLGCDTDTLPLVDGSISDDDIKAKIEWADLVYVGGGNTKMMLEIWRARGVDRLLIEAGERGVVLSGLSAGALCWFQMGCSDWPLFEGRTDIRTGPIDGLGIIKAAGCPHTTREEHRLEDFRAMMKDIALVGLGLDDLCAIHVSDNQYRVVSVDGEAGMHHIEWVDGACVERFIAGFENFQPLDNLIAHQS